MPDYESFNEDDDGKKDEAYDEPEALYDLTFETGSGLRGFVYGITEAFAAKWEKSIHKSYPDATITRGDHVEAVPEPPIQAPNAGDQQPQA
jgi:hypothetical protein